MILSTERTKRRLKIRMALNALLLKKLDFGGNILSKFLTNCEDSKTFKNITKKYPKYRNILHQLAPSSAVCLHRWNAISVQINRSVCVHEWSKYCESFTCCQVRSWCYICTIVVICFGHVFEVSFAAGNAKLSSVVYCDGTYAIAWLTRGLTSFL